MKLIESKKRGGYPDHGAKPNNMNGRKWCHLCYIIESDLFISFSYVYRIDMKSRVSLVRRYGTKLIDHYENPRNVGSIPKNRGNIGTGIVGAPACGDVMKLDIQVENNTIVDAKFKTFGCGSAIASSSYTTEYIKGKTLKELRHFTNQDIASHLKLPPIKLHCSMLAEDALRKAIADYKTK